MVPKHLQDFYNRYIKSPEWKQIRKRAIEKSYWEGGYRCQVCEWDFPKDKLQVHHRHYKTLGKERLIDLLVVCKRCHDKEDERRAKQGKERGESALTNAQFNGWASKVYGEDWYDYYDPSKLFEEFLEWLEQKEEL